MNGFFSCLPDTVAQQAVQVDPAPFATLVKPQPVVSRGVK
jgi:hypothetical protein